MQFLSYHKISTLGRPPCAFLTHLFVGRRVGKWPHCPRDSPRKWAHNVPWMHLFERRIAMFCSSNRPPLLFDDSRHASTATKKSKIINPASCLYIESGSTVRTLAVSPPVSGMYTGELLPDWLPYSVRARLSHLTIQVRVRVASSSSYRSCRWNSTRLVAIETVIQSESFKSALVCCLVEVWDLFN